MAAYGAAVSSLGVIVLAFPAISTSLAPALPLAPPLSSPRRLRAITIFGQVFSCFFGQIFSWSLRRLGVKESSRCLALTHPKPFCSSLKDAS